MGFITFLFTSQQYIDWRWRRYDVYFMWKNEYKFNPFFLHTFRNYTHNISPELPSVGAMHPNLNSHSW